MLANGAVSPDKAAGLAGTAAAGTSCAEAPADPAAGDSGTAGAGTVATGDRSKEMLAPGEACAGTSIAATCSAPAAAGCLLPLP